MRTDVDLARGVDFGRSNENSLGPVLVRFTHLNYDPYDYIINVRQSRELLFYYRVEYSFLVSVLLICCILGGKQSHGLRGCHRKNLYGTTA